MVFRLQNLPVERQRNVGRALGVTLDRTRAQPLTPRTVEAGRNVVSITVQLEDPPKVASIAVDMSTDRVVTATHRILRAWTKGLAGDLVALEPAQQESLNAAQFLMTRWFANGIRFVRQQMSIEWDGLQPIITSFDDPEVIAAVEKLGLGSLVAHLKKHAVLYGQTIGLGEGKPKEARDQAEVQNTWQEAMKRFVVVVLADYPDDEKTCTELLGVYEQQLEEHRAELAAARKDRKEKSIS